jgi:hypothetical protein
MTLRPAIFPRDLARVLTYRNRVFPNIFDCVALKNPVSSNVATHRPGACSQVD